GEAMKPAMDSSIRADVGSEPVVINLTSGNVWLRPLSSVSTHEWDCESIYWSRELGIIINQQQYGTTFGPVKEAVITYTFDGQQVTEYWGKIHGVSPRGEKILVDEDTIIDLRNNKITDLAWHMNYDVGDSSTLYWSSDETRLYRCCFYYADLKTGKGYNFAWSDLRGMDGEPLTIPMHPHQYGHWVRNDSYFLIEWDYWTILYGDPIPMFSPSEKKYYDIAKIAVIPASVVSTSTSDVSPDGMHVWIKGYGDDGQYHGFLINLVDFNTVSYDKPVDEFEWSPDSKYAWMTIYGTSDIYVLSAAEKTLTLFPADSISDLFWRPNDHVVAFFTEQDQVLTFLDVKHMSIKEWKLPASFDNLFWSPDGSHMALIAVDGSLWQVEYPKLENLEQLTPPLSNVYSLNWSPDGNSVSFISGSDLYVVKTDK
ncbi:MAG TPA: hypothetical protein VFQ23_20310, partial [Anaerolineales bacterium]|nr:hypothetical protein [Anaerolineales bacterium]